MKPRLLFSASAILGLFLFLSPAGRAQLPPPFLTELTRSTNDVILTWQAEPGGRYHILSSGGVGLPWVQQTASPLVSPINVGLLKEALAATNKFFQVKLVDVKPPVVIGPSPGAGGIAVTRRGTIDVPIFDDGVIDTNTLTISITNGPPVRMGDPRLSYVAGVLTFTPATGEFLGEYGQFISGTVSVADLAGNRLEGYTWVFQIEPEPILRPTVVVVNDPGSGLILLSTNAAGDVFTYGFLGATSGLDVGMILVSTDPEFIYRRTIRLVTEDTINRTVTVETENSVLEDSFQQGSVQFDAAFEGGALAGVGPGLLPAAGGCCAVNLDGRVLMSTPQMMAEVVRGRFEGQPEFGLRGSFGPAGLAAVDWEVREVLSLDASFQAQALAAGNYTNRVSLGTARRSLPVDFAGPVPARVDAQLEFVLGFEGSWEQPGRITASIKSTNLVAIASRFRGGSWSNEVSRIIRYQAPAPEWETNLTASAQWYVDVILTLSLDGVPGPQVRTRPGLAVMGSGVPPPGHLGNDVFQFDSWAAVLTMDVRAWDASAPVFGPFPLAEELAPVRHERGARGMRRDELAGPFELDGSDVRPIPGMVWIPPGRFPMGRAAVPAPPDVCDCPLTDVAMTNGFHIGQFEVTQGQFLEVMGANLAFHHGGIWGTNLNRPIENVSWEDATNFCRRLTLRERAAGRIPFRFAYRLPTEAEWEYAARSRTTNLFHYGPELPAGWANFDCRLLATNACLENPVAQVVHPPSTNPQPASVGLFAPNWWGVYDAHGNVAEWCLDWLGDTLPGGAAVEPVGDTNGPVRAVRGGSFLDGDGPNRSSARTALALETTNRAVGFRLVLASAPVEFESYELAFTGGFTLIASHFDHGGNTLDEVLRAMPFEAQFLKFSFVDQDFTIQAISDGTSWLDPDTLEPTTLTLEPGDGGFLFLPDSPVVRQFGGLRRPVEVPPTMVSGGQVLSRQVPEPGDYLTIVGRPPVEGAMVRRWNPATQMYFDTTFTNGAWSAGTPTARVGESWVLRLP